MNAALVEAHARLLPWFTNLPRERHPWWMPVGAGRDMGAWGFAEQRALGDSLGVQAAPREVTPLDACLGACGASADARYWVLVDAPPQRSMDAAMRQRLPLWLNRLGLTPHTHITTVRKFRGAELPEEALLDGASVLADEVSAVPPQFVLAGPNARRTLRALHDLLRDREHAAFPRVRALLEAPGTEGRFPHQLEGAAQATALDAWRLRLPREDQNLPPVRIS